jgi:hypothetical protein
VLRVQWVRLTGLAVGVTLATVVAGPGLAAGLPPVAGPVYDGADEEARIQTIEKLALIAITARQCSSIPGWQIDVMDGAVRRALPTLDATALPPMEAARKARTIAIAKSGCTGGVVAADSRAAAQAYGRALVGAGGWVKVAPDDCLPVGVNGVALRAEIDRLVLAHPELADEVTAWRASRAGKSGCVKGADNRAYASDMLMLFQGRPGALVRAEPTVAPKPVAAAVTVPSPTPASAPVVQVQAPSAPGQQTPENAQLFLRTVVGQGGTKVGIDAQYRRTWASYNAYNQPSCQANCLVERSREAPVRSIATPNVCTTDLTFELPSFTESDYVNAAVTWRWDVFPETRNSFRIDWRKVAKASVNGNSVSLSGIGRLRSFILASPELAKRVGYAMEFLRLHCDPTAAMGF